MRSPGSVSTRCPQACHSLASTTETAACHTLIISSHVAHHHYQIQWRLLKVHKPLIDTPNSADPHTIHRSTTHRQKELPNHAPSPKPKPKPDPRRRPKAKPHPEPRAHRRHPTHRRAEGIQSVRHLMQRKKGDWTDKEQHRQRPKCFG